MSTWEHLLAEAGRLRKDQPDYLTPDGHHSRDWTDKEVVEERKRLEQLEEILHKLSSLRVAEAAKLDLADARAKNSRRPVNCLPEDALLAILEQYMVYERANPATLAGVCFRWMTIVLGDIGTVLWSYLNIDSFPSVPLARSLFGAVSLPLNSMPEGVESRRVKHFLRRSRSHLLHLSLIAGSVNGALAALLLPEWHRVVTIDVRPAAAIFSIAPSTISLHHLRRLSVAADASSKSDAPLLICSPPSSLTHLTMKLTTLTTLNRTMESFASCTSLTHFAVELMVSGSEMASLAYKALGGMKELTHLEWIDRFSTFVKPDPRAHRECLPKLVTLLLHGYPAFHAFSAAVDMPALQYLKLSSPGGYPNTIANVNSEVIGCDLLRPNIYSVLLPQLKIAKFSNVEVPTAHLFSLLADHPALSEVFYDGSSDIAGEILVAIPFVMSVTNRVPPRANRDPPLLTLGYSSHFVKYGRVEAHHPVPPKTFPMTIHTTSQTTPQTPKRNRPRARRQKALQAALSPLLPAPVETFGDAIGRELESISADDFELANSAMTSSTPVFRLGVAPQAVADSSRLSRFIQRWPGFLNVRPYHADGVLDSQMD